MTAIALWFYLGLIPKYLPPAATHSQHVPPTYSASRKAYGDMALDEQPFGYGTLPSVLVEPPEALASKCVSKWSENRKLKVSVCWSGQ